MFPQVGYPMSNYGERHARTGPKDFWVRRKKAKEFRAEKNDARREVLALCY
jgi:hypothetical protein